MLLYFLSLIVLVHLAFFTTSITCSEVKKIDLKKLVCLVNYERSTNKAPPVGLDAKLNTAAQVQAMHQADTEQMSHTGPKGSNVGKRVDDAAYQWLSVAENVAFGFNTEEEVVHKWMCSPKHKVNTIDTKHKMLGGSAVTSPKGVVYWTLVLASDAKKEPENVPKCDEYKDAIEALKKLDEAGCGAKHSATKPDAKKGDVYLNAAKPGAKDEKKKDDVKLTVAKPGAKDEKKKEDINLTAVKPGAKDEKKKEDINLTTVKPGEKKKDDVKLTVAKPGAKDDKKTDVNLTVAKPGEKVDKKKNGDTYLTATKPGEKKPADVNLAVAKPPTAANAIDLTNKVFLRCVCDPVKSKKSKKSKKQELKCLCTPDDESTSPYSKDVAASKKKDLKKKKKKKDKKDKKKKKDLDKKKKKKKKKNEDDDSATKTKPSKKDKKKKKKDKKEKKDKKKKKDKKDKKKKDKKKDEASEDAEAKKPKRKRKLKAQSTEY